MRRTPIWWGFLFRTPSGGGGCIPSIPNGGSATQQAPDKYWLYTQILVPCIRGQVFFVPPEGGHQNFFVPPEGVHQQILSPLRGDTKKFFRSLRLRPLCPTNLKNVAAPLMRISNWLCTSL